MSYLCPGCGSQVKRETDLTKPGMEFGDADVPAHRCSHCEVTYVGVDLPEA